MLTVLLSYSVKSQNCNCPQDKMLPKYGSTVRVFSFSSSIKLGICGYHKVVGKDTAYSEFCLFQCGFNKVIDEWDATQICRINQVRDTLFVKELKGLPVGKNMEAKWAPFYINKYYFTNGVLKQETFYRKDLKNYSDLQIHEVLDEYKKLKKDGNYEHLLLVANRLFWAYVSGSKEAEAKLMTMEQKFGPFDGAIAEDWKDLLATYEHWKSKNGSK